MIVYDEITQATPLKRKNVETEIFGQAVSRGVATGKVTWLYGQKRQFYRIELKENQIEGELQRFHAAVRLAKRQIKKIASQTKESARTNKTSILDAHLLILEDKSLSAKIADNIKLEKVNAEWAVKVVTENYIADYKSFTSTHLRERYIDLEDVSNRLLTVLGGEKPNFLPQKNAIIVAKDVKPSSLIELSESNPKAIITERGGWTSHTFILAREMNLPAVSGIDGVLQKIETGDEVIVDGYNGKIILYPTERNLREYKIAAKKFKDGREENLSTKKGNLKTLDGREIIIRANADSPQGFAKAKQFGTHGIGLYRSEFLFNQYKDFPTEQQQIRAYKKIARFVGEEAVHIRTFDLTSEQLANEYSEKESNPALGLRGIRLSLSHSEQFRIQLSALLQASAGNNIAVVLPMISDVSEIFFAKKILQEEKEKLKKRKIEFGNPCLGAMIEVPSAVFTADEIARETDFLNLGTNDLVQYILAVDRDNPAVADLFRTLHPAIIRAIKTVLTAGEKNDVPVIVCGEMAGSPFYAPILIGLGAKVLSMNVNSISRVRKIVSGIAFEETQEIVKIIEKCQTADEIEDLVRNYFAEKWSHLFSSDILPPKKS
jgi:phosphotransferase system enzyme I (PtsI)